MFIKKFYAIKLESVILDIAKAPWHIRKVTNKLLNLLQVDEGGQKFTPQRIVFSLF